MSSNTKARLWWQRPTLRDDEDRGKERKATYLELFYDLVLVAFLAVFVHEAAHEFAHHPSWTLVGKLFTILAPAFGLWITNLYYNQRFETNDVSHRLFTLLQMVTLGFMAFFLQDALTGEGSRGFAYAYSTAKLIGISMWLRAVKYNPKAWETTKLILPLHLLTAGLFFASTFLPSDQRFILWGISSALELASPFRTISGPQRLPSISNEHIIERFGLFIILVLGESIGGVIRGASETHLIQNGQFLITFILGITFAFSLWSIYFDQLLNWHKTSNSLLRVIRNTLHLPLIFSIAGLSAALLEIIKDFDHIIHEPIKALAFGSLSLFLTSITAIEITIRKITKQSPRPTNQFLLIRTIGITLPLVAIALQHQKTGLQIIATLLLITSIQVIYAIVIWVRRVGDQIPEQAGE